MGRCVGEFYGRIKVAKCGDIALHGDIMVHKLKINLSGIVFTEIMR